MLHARICLSQLNFVYLYKELYRDGFLQTCIPKPKKTNTKWSMVTYTLFIEHRNTRLFCTRGGTIEATYEIWNFPKWILLWLGVIMRKIFYLWLNFGVWPRHNLSEVFSYLPVLYGRWKIWEWVKVSIIMKIWSNLADYLQSPWVPIVY